MSVATDLIDFNRLKVNKNTLKYSINYYIETNTNYGNGNDQEYSVDTSWRRTKNCGFTINSSDGNTDSGDLQKEQNGNYTYSDELSINSVDFESEDDSLKKETVVLTMNWEYAEGTWEWGNTDWTYNERISSRDEIKEYDTGKERLVIYSGPTEVEWGWTDEGEIDYDNPIEWEITYYTQESVPGEVNWNSGIATSDFYFYPAPNSFSFNNCSSGNKWNIAEGLQSLITNIYLFTPYATQWKNWKYGNLLNSDSLSNQGSCPTFQRGRLSASNLNEIHAYVGTGNSYAGGYRKENRVGASMFNSLAEKISEE